MNKMSKISQSSIPNSESLAASSQIIKGNKHTDERGTITYNNAFDATKIKRIYTIENLNTDFFRGWQGHQIESRWFAVMKGKFRIGVIQFENLNDLNYEFEIKWYEIEEGDLDYLYLGPKHLSCIQALEIDSKLLVLSDYALGEVQDELRYPLEYFVKK